MRLSPHPLKLPRKEPPLPSLRHLIHPFLLHPPGPQLPRAIRGFRTKFTIFADTSSEPPNTMGTMDTYIVKKPCNKLPCNWKRADVLTFLNNKKEEYDFDDKHIKVIEDSQLTGRGFLKLTKNELVKDYGLPRGVAASIEILIKTLKQPQGKLLLPQYDILYWHLYIEAQVEAVTPQHPSENRRNRWMNLNSVLDKDKKKKMWNYGVQ